MSEFSGKFFIALFLLGAVLVFGCTQAVVQQDNPAMNGTKNALHGDSMGDGSGMGGSADDAMANDANGDSMMDDAGGERMSGHSSYVPFSQEAYERAKSEGKTIFLEFYANWCPTCAEQKPVLESTFFGLDNPAVVGFQVNFNDSDTDGNEMALAKKFGITYQHTHIITNSDETVLLRGVGQWSSDEIIKNIDSVR